MTLSERVLYTHRLGPLQDMMPIRGNLTADILSRKVTGLRKKKKNLQSEPCGNKSSNRAEREREASCLLRTKGRIRRSMAGATQALCTYRLTQFIWHSTSAFQRRQELSNACTLFSQTCTAHSKSCALLAILNMNSFAPQN